MTRASVVLIDGEHYPPVVARAIAELKERDENPVLALLVGGGEKLDGEPSVGIPVQVAEDAERDLAEAIDRTGATRVIDISDEPVLGYLARFRLASVALWKQASYVGADFELNPPSRELAPSVPSVAVIGTGKRTGKTGVGGAAARAFHDAGLNPVVVAMGRGGPPEPELIEAGALLDPETLLEWSEAGRHAASDYIEDALVAGVPTVGAWRAGGGLAGEPAFTNYTAAVRRAEKMKPGTLILEGSGAAIPPTRFDAAILVADAAIDPAFLCGYLGLYRVLLADLVVLTMVEESVDRRRLAEVEDCLSSSLNKPKVLRTVFRPHPLGEVSGQKVFLVTTAPGDSSTVLSRHLSERHGADVVGVSNSLADREGLRRDLEAMPEAETLLVELKAAAVDVATRFGLDHGLRVVYMDNRPETSGEGEPIDHALVEVARLAQKRFG